MVQARGRKVRQCDPRANSESGQALLELALVTPLLVLLVMAIFQFAYVLESQVGLTNAVREAARRIAATEPATAPSWAGAQRTWTLEQLCGTTAGSCNSGLLQQNVQGFDDTKLWATYPNVTFCYDTVSSVKQYRVLVEVKYKHPVFFGPLAFATDLVDEAQNGFWDLGAAAQIRMEHIDPTMAGFADPATVCS